LGQIKEEEMMVIQSYDVKTTSQRSFVSVESTTMLATRQLQLARNTWGFQPPPPQVNQQNPQGNQNSQGNNANTGVGQTQNSGNNGQTGAGQTRNTGNNANTGVGQTQNSGNNGQTAQIQDEDSAAISNRSDRRRQSKILKDLLKELRSESLTHIASKSSASYFSKVQISQKSKIPSNPQELKAHLLQLMLELLGGKKASQTTTQQTDNNESRPDVHSFGSRGFSLGFANIFGGAFAEGNTRLERIDGWRVEHFQYESEQVSYQAKGVVHTADGRTITVDINMYMSREFVAYMGIDVEATRPVDPLVINYGGTASSLMGDRFQFDLTMDGNLDHLAVLGEGSGFLAIDWDGTGVIKDGSQLFGPSTGCGFSELRQYDKDGNGWIDANDEIFDKLVVWHRDKDGNDTVFTLKELGIGAIYLGDIETEFSFKDETNQTLGIMRSTSFFLKECGGAGTVSHIDMMI